MFGLPAGQLATTARSSTGLWVGEVVATAGLIALIRDDISARVDVLLAELAPAATH